MKPLGGEADVYEKKSSGGESTILEEPESATKGGTTADHKDMYRMNKQQELGRNFRFLSNFGYSLILGNGWVIALIAAIIPLTNGGTAGGIYMYLIVIIGMVCSTLSMAETASMASTAGGQYHWVSEFAPREYQQSLSYLTGWLCVSSVRHSSGLPNADNHLGSRVANCTLQYCLQRCTRSSGHDCSTKSGLRFSSMAWRLAHGWHSPFHHFLQ